MGCDVCPCLKGPEMKYLKRHYNGPLCPLHSLFCALCMSPWLFSPKGRNAFFIFFIFSFIFFLVWKDCTGRCYCKCDAYCSIAAFFFFYHACQLKFPFPPTHTHTPPFWTITLSVCLMAVASGAYRRENSKTLFLRVMPACWDFWDISCDCKPA